ncbi:MAG: beta-ketoacyl-ACP synthase II [Planctomycetota bacterium]|nr:MAG: beta-ketoacyl-ACP synthase II [Planctomycetota bacterium]
MSKRVVVTGMGGISPIGHNWEEVQDNLKNLKSGVEYIADWDQFDELVTRCGAPVKNFEKPAHYTRKQVRSMGRVSILSTRASEIALIDAGLLEDPIITSGAMGVAFGSCTGSTDAIWQFARMRAEGSMRGITATSYIRMMPHTTAANVGLFFHLKGRVIPTSSACTSGSQGIGYSYEAIKNGKQILMIAGGAEELCVTEAAVFDVMYATTKLNDTPQLTPRPFDEERDGLVIGEGAGALVLEDLEYAKARGAKIYAEVVGFGTNSDGSHITQPSHETMMKSMEMALDDAKLSPDAIGYVNAHATATELGDIAESIATHNLFGSNIPVSSLKSYMGHTLGASGSLESWMSIEMMNNNWYAPTLHLKNIDNRCAELDYIKDKGRQMQNEYVMNNNFAFGGINTSLIFKRWG